MVKNNRSRHTRQPTEIELLDTMGEVLAHSRVDALDTWGLTDEIAFAWATACLREAKVTLLACRSPDKAREVMRLHADDPEI